MGLDSTGYRDCQGPVWGKSCYSGSSFLGRVEDNGAQLCQEGSGRGREEAEASEGVRDLAVWKKISNPVESVERRLFDFQRYSLTSQNVGSRKEIGVQGQG